MRRPAFVVALVVAGIAVGCDYIRMGTHAIGGVAGTPAAVPNKITSPVRTDARLAVLWIGHATVLLQLDDKLVLTDPVFTPTVGQISKRLVEPGLEPQNLPTVDAVLISHMHMDHLSVGSLELIEKKIRRLFVPPGGLVYVPDLAFDARELPTWRSWEKDGLRITAVPVDHAGWRYGEDRAWLDRAFTGYVIEYHGLSVYFGGDTCYRADLFAETAKRFPSLDLALLPIAPIKPRPLVKDLHTDPTEALAAFQALGAKVMMPIHFETFPHGLDAPGDPRVELEAVRRAKNIDAARVAALRIGEQRVLVAKGK